MFKVQSLRNGKHYALRRLEGDYLPWFCAKRFVLTIVNQATVLQMKTPYSLP